MQTQIKLNLSTELKSHVEERAKSVGIPLAGYIKHLILKDVDQMRYFASESTEKAHKSMVKDKKNGKLIEVNDVDLLFDQLS